MIKASFIKPCITPMAVILPILYAVVQFKYITAVNTVVSLSLFHSFFILWFQRWWPFWLLRGDENKTLSKHGAKLSLIWRLLVFLFWKYLALLLQNASVCLLVYYLMMGGKIQWGFFLEVFIENSCLLQLKNNTTRMKQLWKLLIKQNNSLKDPEKTQSGWEELQSWMIILWRFYHYK